MPTVQESIEVHADAQRVYEMWAHFEHYPEFMPGIVEVRRTGETLWHWTAEYEGRRHEWDAQVIQMDPEEKIVFQTTHEPVPVRSTVAFSPVEDGTRITFALENDPAPESMSARLIAQGLANFRAIAEQGPPTKWPGAIPAGAAG